MRWADLRLLVLARPLGGRCERCGERPATDAHHRKMRSQGGQDRASNLAAVCRQCHDWIHKHPDKATLGGWLVRSHDDPQLRAVLLHDGSIAQLDDDACYSFQQWPSGPRIVRED